MTTIFEIILAIVCFAFACWVGSTVAHFAIYGRAGKRKTRVESGVREMRRGDDGSISFYRDGVLIVTLSPRRYPVGVCLDPGHRDLQKRTGQFCTCPKYIRHPECDRCEIRSNVAPAQWANNDKQQGEKP